jgi:hypothetical protein
MLAAAASIHVDVRFAHASADLDTSLFAPVADAAHDAPRASRDSTDDDEHCDFVAAAAGNYLLLVRAYDLREAPDEFIIE